MKKVGVRVLYISAALFASAFGRFSSMAGGSTENTTSVSEEVVNEVVETQEEQSAIGESISSQNAVKGASEQAAISAEASGTKSAGSKKNSK